MLDLATAHGAVIEAPHKGFALLITNGVAGRIAGILALRAPGHRPAPVLMRMACGTVPLALALRHVLGFPPYGPENPLNQLGLSFAFVPAVAIPAAFIAYVKHPIYLPSVMAAVVGGHFLPYSWLYQTYVYL